MIWRVSSGNDLESKVAFTLQKPSTPSTKTTGKGKRKERGHLCFERDLGGKKGLGGGRLFLPPEA